MIDIFKKPYDLLEHKRFKFLLTFGSAIFVFVFLLIFKPFGLYKLSFSERIYSVALYFIIGLPIPVLHIYVLQGKLIKKFTVGITIIWLTWIFLLVSISNFFVNSFLFTNGYLSLINLIALIGVTLIESVIPITLIILLHYSFVLKKRYLRACEMNKDLNKKNHSNSIKKIIITAENPKNNLEIEMKSLIYIKSEDNYIDVYYFLKDKTKHKLLRNSLTNLEKDLGKVNNIIRCHKSYMVNIDNVEEIKGNSIGYQLKLIHTKLLIPVSRKLNKNIHQIIKQI